MTESTALTVAKPATGFGLVMSPQTIADTRAFCEMLAKTEFVPKAYRGKPDSIMVVGAMGARLGVDVFSAMAGIADINGRPTVYGDLMLACCMDHPAFEDCIETFKGNPYEDTFTAICVAKRKGREPVERSFSVVEAKEAGLWKKAGPWTNTPQRMLQMRARSFALRDTFADRLAGFHSREEMEDARDVTADAVVHSDPKPAKARDAAAIEQAINPGGPISPAVQAEINEALAAASTAPGSVPPHITKEIAAEAGQQTIGEALTATQAAPPRDVSTKVCTAAYAALWNGGEAALAKAKAIRADWKLDAIADLAGANDDDRQAFLLDIDAAWKELGGKAVPK